MSVSRRVVAVTSIVAAGLALAGTGVFLTVVGLEDADRWASVFSLFLTAVGLGVSIHGVILSRRESSGKQNSGQRVGGDVHGRNVQLGEVGDVRIGSAAGKAPKRRRGARPRGGSPAGSQEVGGSVWGSNTQIGSADDVDVD